MKQHNKKTEKGERFEKQIKRILDLIHHADAQIEWNDRIPDPDNPKQGRQIDITIRRDNTLTIVECRAHEDPQDVKWIEELIGRRISLNANMVIAVSSSGFTGGAISKAKNYGIILRNLSKLSDEEIASWGQTVALIVTFYEYKNVCIEVFFRKDENKPLVTSRNIYDYFRDNIFRLIEIYNGAAETLEKKQFITPAEY